MTNHPNRNWRRRLAADAAALGPDLVSAYIALHGGPTAAARALSESAGRRYSANLMCRWRRGEAPTPVLAQQAMRWHVICVLMCPPPFDEQAQRDFVVPIYAVLSPPGG